MASIATGLDYESAGIQTSTGAEMRARQSDQQGGTDAYDAAEAWESYGQTLTIRDGHTFDDARADLVGGRLVHLDVWAAACGGPCLSGTGQYGHTIAVAPEQSGSRWLVADPWCSPAKWTWWDEELLREGAEAWGRQCYTEATAGMAGLREALLLALMRRAAKRLMSEYRPDAPATLPPPETSGAGGRIMFTTTSAPEQAEETDMPINGVAAVWTGIRATGPQGLDFYADPNLVKRLGSMSAEFDVVYIGNPVGETVEGGSRAIQINTSTAYADHVARPTVVYVAAGAVDTYSVPPPDSTDEDAIIARVHEEWEYALQHGEAWPSRA